MNDRWGKGLRGKVGDYYTTEYGHHAGDGATAGIKPFEECRGIGGSFAFNRAEDYDHYASRTACVRLLIDLAAQGGTLLLDIGPTADGRVPVIMQDRLIAMGEWPERERRVDLRPPRRGSSGTCPGAGPPPRGTPSTCTSTIGRRTASSRCRGS